MARKTNAAGTASAAPEKQQTVGGRRFSVAKLRQNCGRLFGITTSTFDGATYGMTGEYTVEDMKAHIEKWVKTKKEVKK